MPAKAGIHDLPMKCAQIFSLRSALPPTPMAQRNKSFLLLFFNKEALPSS
jgi:hypothetical protein